MSETDLEYRGMLELAKSVRAVALARSGVERFCPPRIAAARLGWTLPQLMVMVACGGVTTTRRHGRLLVYVSR